MHQLRLQDHAETVLEALNQQRLQEEQACDVKIHSIDGKIFMAHSNVLAACTPKLLPPEIKERCNYELVMSIQSGIISTLLDGIYSGHVSVDSQTDQDSLYQLASDVGFTQLIKLLEDSPFDTLTAIPTENAEMNAEKTITLDRHCCKICHRYFVTRQSLDKHTVRYHKVQGDSENAQTAETKESNAIESTNDDDFEESNVTNDDDFNITGTENKEKIMSSKICLCSLCDKIFLDINKLKQHNVRVHKLKEDIPTWKCPGCDEILVKKIAYEDHLRRHGLKELLCCSECSAEFISRESYQDHVNTKACKHPGDLVQHKSGRTVWKRAIGVKNSTREQWKKDKYKQKRKAVTSNTKDPIKEKRVKKSNVPSTPVTCDLCSNTFRSQHTLGTHYMKIHNMSYGGEVDREKKTAICELCGQCCASDRAMKVHQKRVHSLHHLMSENDYFCKLCDKRLISKREFEDHQRGHGLLPKLLCQLCGKEFTSRGLFLTHVKKRLCQPDAQLDFRPVCDVCSKSYATSCALKRHQIAVHSYNHLSKYYCTVCNTVCKDSSDMKNHNVRHGLQEKFRCNYCEKTFLHSRSLEKHRKKLHPEHKVRPHKKYVKADVKNI